MKGIRIWQHCFSQCLVNELKTCSFNIITPFPNSSTLDYLLMHDNV